MENEKLTYINSRGERLELGVDSVYHCNISKDVEGISGVTSVIYSTNSMGQHGDTYVGQRIEARDIDVVGHINTRDKAQALELRRRMLKIFNPELSATLVYEYGGFKRVIDCRAYMVYLGGGTWVDIYLNSDDGAKGLKSEYGCAPMTGTESMNWYNFVERLAKSGKRLPNYAEFCAYAFGSPAGLDNANTNAWSATSNTGRGVTGSVVNAVSSVGVVDAVGRVWEWLDELITRAEHATNADYHASVAWGWDKKSPLNTGEKSYDVGNIYQYYAYSLAALIAGGSWYDGANCGARAVACSHYPWSVNTYFGARGACDSL